MKYLIGAICATMLFSCRKEITTPKSEMPYGGWIAPSSDTVWLLPPYDVVVCDSQCEWHGLINIEWFDDSLSDGQLTTSEIRRRHSKDRMK